MNQLVTIHNEVNWLFIYISEAHAMDEWPLQSPRCTNDNKPVIVNQTRSLENRIISANDFIQKYNFLPKMYISSPELLVNFEIIYKPWPFRIYGFEGNNITFASEPKDCETHLDDIVDWIKK